MAIQCAHWGADANKACTCTCSPLMPPWLVHDEPDPCLQPCVINAMHTLQRFSTLNCALITHIMCAVIQCQVDTKVCQAAL